VESPSQEMGWIGVRCFESDKMKGQPLGANKADVLLQQTDRVRVKAQSPIVFSYAEAKSWRAGDLCGMSNSSLPGGQADRLLFYCV